MYCPMAPPVDAPHGPQSEMLDQRRHDGGELRRRVASFGMSGLSRASVVWHDNVIVPCEPINLGAPTLPRTTQASQ